MLKLKLQSFGYLMWRVDSFEKTPMLGKIDGRRRRGQQRMRWLDGIQSLGKFRELVMDREAWRAAILGSQRVGYDWSTELNWRWDGWIESSTQWTWVWMNSGSWWWTGRPGVLWFMGCKESDMIEWLNWTELNRYIAMIDLCCMAETNTTLWSNYPQT